MSTSAKDLRETLTAHCKHERHRTYAETSYWLGQYKDLARRAVQHAESVTAKLQEQIERTEAAEAELCKLREQEPVAWDCSAAIPLYAAAGAAPTVPDDWREVMAELAADLQASIEAEHAYRDQYSSVMRKYQNDMRIVERARSLLQSAEVRHD